MLLCRYVQASLNDQATKDHAKRSSSQVRAGQTCRAHSQGGYGEVPNSERCVYAIIEKVQK